jgi:phage-related protein
MSSYAFQIDVEGNSIQGFRKLEEGAEHVNKKAKEIHNSFSQIGESVTHLGSEFKSLALGALGLGSIFAGFEFIKSSLEAFDKLEESITKVETVLTSTGHAAGLSLREIEGEAKKLSGQTLFGRAAIMDAQSMLLTFTAIRGEIFNKSIPAVADFATRFKMDLPEAANTLGKALNDPLKGMTRLQRQGVVFSDQQKQTITRFVQTGQVAKAQEVILKELATEFGGLAHAMTLTDEGKLKMAAKQLGEFKLMTGELASKFLVSLIPAFNKIVGLAKDFKHWLTGDSESAYIFKEIIIVIAGALALYGGYLTIITIGTKLWTAAQWLLNIAMDANPVGLIIIGIVALVAAIAILWDKCEGFRIAVGAIFEVVKKYVMGMVHYFMNLGTIIGDIFTGNWSKLREDSKKFTSDFKNDFITGWGDAWKKGAEQGKKSEFKFGGLIGLGKKEGGKESASGLFKSGEKGGLAQSAINTSALSGASGGLGEAKIIKIDFHKALMEVNVPGGNGMDILSKAPLSVEMMLRIINNLSMSQGSTM